MSVFLLILLGCGADQAVYTDGFPENNTKGLREFMQGYLFNLDNHLFTRGNNQIYAKHNGNSELNAITYFQFTEKDLEDYYQSLYTSNELSKERNRLFEHAETLQNKIDDSEMYNLPEIKKTDNKLIIKTASTQAEFTMEEFNHELNMDEITMNLIALNKYGFILHLEDYNASKHYYLFASEDLSEIGVYEKSELNVAIESGDFERYYPVLEQIGQSGIYAKLYNGSIVNMEENTIHSIRDEDKRSKDWNYVYVNGDQDELSDGPQKIQTIDNYLEGNNKYEAEFTINFKKIAKEADINSSTPSTAKVYYFSKEMIVLELSYEAFLFGSAGSTNVLIDLQEDKEHPTAYIIDLGI